METIPSRFVVTSLDHKLTELRVDGLAADWYRRSCEILRGGDRGLLLYKRVRQRQDGTHPLVILDVGTARGFSAITMARALHETDVGSVYTIDVIDHYDARSWQVKQQQSPEPLAGMTLSRSEIWRRWYPREAELVTPIKGQSWAVLGDWVYGPIDVAFIDGDHSRTAVSKELALLSQFMAPGGVIVLDDYFVEATVLRVRSRYVNRLANSIGKRIRGPWPSASRRLRLGWDNEFILVKQKFSGIKAAVQEFLVDQQGGWALEVIRMPERGGSDHEDYSGYSLALLTKT